ncbi:MAG: hypothetical protein GVY09_13220 [Gammaproteobacteria bacterium]|nr:hypothetical protein [Gammaproteobacteria bacterium]
MIFEVHSVTEIEARIAEVGRNARTAREAMKALPEDPVEALMRMKFEPIGSHPLEARALNLVEQINQTFTYLIALKAARLLLQWHTEAGGLRLAPGAHTRGNSLDIEGLVPGVVGAETFAAVALTNNGKLAKDLTKLAARPETHRYVFFGSPRYPDTARLPAKERSGVAVWSICMHA